MTVADLIELLQTHNQNALVAYRCYSEACLLEPQYVNALELCPPRPDGWIHDARPDVEKVPYVMFPGN
jgi:hypothetical protein